MSDKHVTDRDRAAYARKTLERWISNFEANMDRAPEARRHEIRARLDDARTMLAILDGSEDAYISLLNSRA